MRVLCTIVLSALFSLSCSTTTPAGTSTEDEVQVRELERRRFDAMIRADRGALESMLASNLSYTHSNADVENKEQFLANIQSGALDYHAIDPQEMNVRIYENAAVITGLAKVRLRNQGRELDIALRYTDVYVREGGAWKLAAWQSTRVP